MNAEPGQGMSAGGHASARSSDADRERAIEVLKAAFAEGRLTREEHSERVQRVYHSRTYAELAELSADLPAGPLGTLPTQPRPTSPPRHGRPTRSPSQPWSADLSRSCPRRSPR
jgi:Domain of unknown function (DUF1707)